MPISVPKILTWQKLLLQRDFVPDDQTLLSGGLRNPPKSPFFKGGLKNEIMLDNKKTEFERSVGKILWKPSEQLPDPMGDQT